MFHLAQLQSHKVLGVVVGNCAERHVSGEILIAPCFSRLQGLDG